MSSSSPPDPRVPGAEAPAPRRAAAKRFVVFGAKVVVATVLIGWLVKGGALDFSALRVMIDKPWLLVLDLLVFFTGGFLGAMRWRALLSIPDVRPPIRRVTQLHFTALFFNIVIPGNVGGDVVKALYVARDEAPEKRTTILLIVFIERLIGLGGLVVMATLVTVLRGPTLFNDPVLRPLAITVALIGAATVLGPAIFMMVIRRAGARFDAWTSGPSKLAKLANQLVAALRLLSTAPKKLALALAFSMGVHALNMVFFTILTGVLTGVDVPFSSVATVYPLGILTLILPISPAGLGVGHVAFDRLFDAIGLKGGATVFNVYLIGQIVPALSGVVPYLSLRRDPPVEVEQSHS